MLTKEDKVTLNAAMMLYTRIENYKKALEDKTYPASNPLIQKKMEETKEQLNDIFRTNIIDLKEAYEYMKTNETGIK